MKKINYEQYKETIYYNEINSLRVVYLPKESFSKTCVNLTVDYGGADLDYNYNGKDYHSISGCAHFIEHKIFEMEDGSDAFFKLSSLGANANAYTTNKKTSYLFSTTNNLFECFDVFFSYLLTETFNEKSVNNEKGIIVEELQMYLNDPMYNVQTKLLKNMFKNLHLNKQILGDEESINSMTVECLKTAYKAFYHPKNMILYVSGKFDLEELDSYLTKELSKYKFDEFNTYKLKCDEPLEVCKEYEVLNINSDVTFFTMGVKMSFNKEEFYYNFVCLYAFCYLIFSKSNSKIVEFLEKNIIFDDFTYYFEIEEDYTFLEVVGSTNEEELLHDELTLLVNSCEKFIDEEGLSRFKNLCYANFIYQIENMEELGEEIKASMFSNYDYFSIKETLDRININDILAIKSQFIKENISVVIGKNYKK